MEENRRKEILELLQTNARYTPQEIAAMLNMEAADVAEIIKKMEEEGLIIGYQVLVNWNKISAENVIALIEVKVSPQRDVGFDAVDAAFREDGARGRQQAERLEQVPGDQRDEHVQLEVAL